MISKHTFFFISIVTCILAFSCSKSSENVTDLPPLFDLNEYVTSLETKQTVYQNVKRTILADDQKEENEYDELDLSQQFDYLRQMNINNPRLLDKYALLEDGNKTIYSANDSTLAVRKIELLSDGDEVYGVIIDHEMSTLISSSSKRIIFYSDSLFSIHTTSKSILGKERDLHTKWEF